MNMKKSIWAILTCVVGGLAIACIGNREMLAEHPKNEATPKKATAMQLFMRVKLGQAQGILEGLTLEDFGQVEKEATTMFLLTKAEQWKARKDPKFLRHADEFARLTEKLAKYAKNKNLDGASLTYMQLTLNCIECHRSVRDPAIEPGRLPDDDGGQD